MARHLHNRRRARGVATLEFVFILIFGVMPLVLATGTGVLVMAAHQAVTLAAAEGARASLGDGTPSQRKALACATAASAMAWLLEFSDDDDACTSGAIRVESVTCGTSDLPGDCMRVRTRFEYGRHPLLPGTGRLYTAAFDGPVQSVAIVRLGDLD
ncbi:TadE family protein [Luteimonas abyssi]|jgi:Flp pilus assembly protein TadG|uniref:TadE family protein n=1 Tax=Luteimonas abyssi TaxID=1247514 RepID=UPI000737C502|nr:TadE family protein [Luteimonas abyssi]